MQKKVFERINLTCLFQNTIPSFGEAPSTLNSQPSTKEEPQVLSGMLSTTASGGILFQETLPRRRDIRNAKIYEGEHVSMVRRKDGRYYPLLKAFKPEEVTDKSTLAFRIYSEISEALNTID